MMLKCAYCDKWFKYESERKRHQESHVPQFGCTVCAKTFSFLSALRRHQKQHERKGSVQCNECGGNFRDNTLLKRHMQYAHTGSYGCLECSATFSSNQALRTHTKVHKPESERRFRCSFVGCKKTFNFPHHLKHHELTHTNAKQHFCNVCQKGFIQSHHLKTHLKIHHPENWLHCTVTGCIKKFITKHAWRKHTTTHSKCTGVNHTEIRTDSGISSDSNPSNDIHEKGDSGDNVQRDTCGKVTKRLGYLNHPLNCTAAPKALTALADLNDALLKQDSNFKLQDGTETSSNGTCQVASSTFAVNAMMESSSKYKCCCTHHSDVSENNNTATKGYNGNLSTHGDATSAACAGCSCEGGRAAPRCTHGDATSAACAGCSCEGGRAAPRCTHGDATSTACAGCSCDGGRAAPRCTHGAATSAACAGCSCDGGRAAPRCTHGAATSAACAGCSCEGGRAAPRCTHGDATSAACAGCSCEGGRAAPRCTHGDATSAACAGCSCEGGRAAPRCTHGDATSAACAGCSCEGGRAAPRSRGRDKTSLTSNQLGTCINNNMPKLEDRKDGIIKIRETFDADIVIVKNKAPESNKKVVARKNKDKMDSNDLKFVPFNSCKAVLGNCIVSEDGSVGEECLCARMVVDEQQISAQEIDELTPNSNALW